MTPFDPSSYRVLEGTETRLSPTLKLSDPIMWELAGELSVRVLNALHRARHWDQRIETIADFLALDIPEFVEATPNLGAKSLDQMTATQQLLREHLARPRRCRNGLEEFHALLAQPAGTVPQEQRIQAKDLTFNCHYAMTPCGWSDGDRITLEDAARELIADTYPNPEDQPADVREWAARNRPGPGVQAGDGPPQPASEAPGPYAGGAGRTYEEIAEEVQRLTREQDARPALAGSHARRQWVQHQIQEILAPWRITENQATELARQIDDFYKTTAFAQIYRGMDGIEEGVRTLEVLLTQLRAHERQEGEPLQVRTDRGSWADVSGLVSIALDALRQAQTKQLLHKIDDLSDRPTKGRFVVRNPPLDQTSRGGVPLRQDWHLLDPEDPNETLCGKSLKSPPAPGVAVTTVRDAVTCPSCLEDMQPSKCDQWCDPQTGRHSHD